MTLRTEAERTQIFARRAVLLGGGMGLVGATLGARMAYLSLFEGEKYRLASEDNRVSLRLIPPRRGWIVDRSGLPLAANAPDYGLELIPEQVRDLEATLRAIMRVLPLTLEDLARIRFDVARRPGAMPVAVASGLAWQQFAALNVRLHDLPGVVPVQSFARVYAGGSAFAHLLGYVGTPTPEQYSRDRDPLLVFPGFKLGKDGIERTQDALLRGKPGARRVEVNARGKIIRELDTQSDVPGASVRLTIDRGLQEYAARRLGSESASVIVMDCQTGDVLCLLSSPAYDPNVFSTRVTSKLWAELQSSDAHPLINKSAQGLYPPGSTFKMMTALAALQAGIGPEASVVCRGVYRYGRGLWHCHSRRGHGHVDLHTAIPQSCDVYFYTYGRAAGNQAIADMARRFGLGQKFDLPLPGQAKGIVPDAAWKTKRYGKDWTIGETLNASIGQGYLIANPLQLAVMAARLATGRAVVPRLLADAPHSPAPSLGIPEDHLALIRQGMVDVVNGRGGTATRSRIMVDGVVMAGKTGSAQVRRITMAERRRGVTRQEQMPWKFRDHALFVAFAPVVNPRYAVSVIVEHGMHGGSAAAPVARDVLTYLFEPARANATLGAIEADLARRKATAEAAARAVEAAAAAALAPPPPAI